jgi:type I restriction enzyme, S subunit
MSKKKKLTPELRFPEFKNEGEWSYDKIENIFHLQDGYAFSSNAFTNSKEDSKQVIRITDINNQNKNSDKVYVWEDTVKVLGLEKYKVKKGDLLLSLTGAAGFNFFIWKSEDAYINQRTMKLNSKKKENDSLKIILEPLVHSKINEIGTGQNNNLSKDALKEIEFPFPNPKEQQKIAFCLSSLDELIEAHSQKLDLLKVHKNGLMQNLFPIEGEKVPKHRFPEFKKDEVWTEKSLDEVATILKGKGISKADIVEDGDLPCIRYGELYTHYKETIRTVKSYTNSNAEDLVLSKANDVIIPASGETQIDIATASCVLESGIALGGDLNIIRSKINGVFLSYYLNNSKKQDIAQMAQGIAVVHLYPNQLKTLQLQIPSPKEQLKIASCLSSLDDIISTQIDKIEQLKQHKKGLMQGLFPKIIE